MFGTVIQFDGAVRTGLLEGDGGLRYFFNAYSLSFPVKIGDEFEFASAMQGVRRVASDLRKVVHKEAPRLPDPRRERHYYS